MSNENFVWFALGVLVAPFLSVLYVMVYEAIENYRVHKDDKKWMPK